MNVKVNGIDMYYEKVGSGRPLVMVHGNGEDHKIFDVALDLLKKRFTCYAVDSRCHGKSSKVDELHYDDMAADMIAFMETLDLSDVVFYGFSDGGVIGLLAAMKCPRITTLIVSGANMNPQGVKPGLNLFFKIVNLIHKDPMIELMIREPDITEEQLAGITARTLVLAGSRDLIREKETRRIAAAIPGATLRIVKGEGHGSYIVHKEKIAKLIMDFVS